MDKRIDRMMYQLEDMQEELKDLESIDRASLLERVAELRERVEEVLEVLDDIELGG